MILEGRAAGCFSATFVLKLNGRPVGKYEGRWFSESLDVALTERRRLEFHKVGWMGSDFELLAAEQDEEEVLGSCRRSGIFTSGWDLHLSAGAAHLVRPGWFDTSYEVRQGDGVLARVDRLGWCERGWYVEAYTELTEEDMILIGLV